MAWTVFAGADPWQVVPERFRAPEPQPRVMTDEERAIAQEIGLLNLGQMLKREG